MNKYKLIATLAASVFIISACGSSETSSEEVASESAVSGEISEAELEVKGEFVTIAEKAIKESYGIDNFEIDISSNKLSVFNSTDEMNSETGEEYNNVINGMGEFTYQDNIYRFNILYSKTSEDSYQILFMDSDYNHDLGIDIPLDSD